MVFTLSPTVLSAGTQPWSTALGSFNGVVNYSNDPTTMPSPQPSSYVNGQYMGLKWECVEYVRRYYYFEYGLNLFSLSGALNARDFFNHAAIMQLAAYPNGGTSAPEVGDILCFSPTSSGLGHVAIVRAVGSTTVTVIQQNVKNGDTGPNGPDESYTFAYNSGEHIVDVPSAGSSHLGATYFCQGWLRKNTSQPPDLIAQNLTITPGSGSAGSSVNLSFTIANVGGSAANPSTANIRLASSNSGVTTTDPLLTSISVPTVAPSGTFPVKLSVTIPGGATAGQNYVWVILDAGSTAGQGAGNEANDKSNTPFTVQGPTGVFGIDVSHFQGTVDWSQVRSSGKGFAFVKATGGTEFTDDNFALNMQNGKSAGLLMGAYHFAYPADYSAVFEAQHFLAIAGTYTGTSYLPPVLDIEDDLVNGSTPGASLGKAALSKWILDWATYVEQKTGVKPILYMTRYYAANYMDPYLNSYPIWIVTDSGDPGAEPSNLSPWSDWTFQQYRYGSSGGSCPGVSGPVDLDSFNGSVADLDALAHQSPSDTQGPTLVIASPVDGATVSNANLLVMGTATDNGRGNNGIGYVTVNGISAATVTASGDGTTDWSLWITLTPGANVISVVATDSLNNETRQQIVVTYQPWIGPHEIWSFTSGA
ncbi:MAG TPA: GH25 family lysozyme, partial [Lacipirellulaceae bacterium]|nr:GH25 family lysozyme [Lacipirellulaceae bacterium]